ncbi:hypothetical protein KAW64_07785 [bacterium]|nr:hypothetical protein [bacterium]
MRLCVYKVIFAATEVKMGLYTRPIFAERVESTAGNHAGVGAVNRMNWLPGAVSQSVLLWDVIELEMVTGLKGHMRLSLLRHTN